MDKGQLIQSALERNINHIYFYAQEERTNLMKIFTALDNCCQHYNTTNSQLFQPQLTTNKNYIEKIYDKRIAYITTINQAIIHYNELGVNTTKSFQNYTENK